MGHKSLTKARRTLYSRDFQLLVLDPKALEKPTAIASMDFYILKKHETARDPDINNPTFT